MGNSLKQNDGIKTTKNKQRKKTKIQVTRKGKAKKCKNKTKRNGGRRTIQKSMVEEKDEED